MSEITVESLQQQIQQMVKRKQELFAEVNAIEGATQLCNSLILQLEVDEIEDPPDEI